MLSRVEDDWRTAGLSQRRIVMLEYATKLTTNPGKMSRTDVVSLRDAGFSDRDVLDICEVVAYYAYVNRLADGLGVAVEEWFKDE